MSNIYYALYRALYFSLPNSLMLIVGICVPYIIIIIIIIIKSEVGIISHRLGLGHETMVYAVYRAMFW